MPASSVFITVERTIVDWFDANAYTVIKRGGEFFVDDEREIPLTELAAAIVEAVNRS